MHDLDRIAEAYIAAWNETDAGRRDVLIEQASPPTSATATRSCRAMAARLSPR